MPVSLWHRKPLQKVTIFWERAPVEHMPGQMKGSSVLQGWGARRAGDVTAYPEDS